MAGPRNKPLNKLAKGSCCRILLVMSGSNRLRQLVIGGCFLIGFLAGIPAIGVSQDKPDDSAAAEQSATERKPDPAPQIEVPVEVPAAPEVMEAPSVSFGGVQDSANDDALQLERAEADLKAQKEMARWAFWMFVASAGSAVIAAVAVILVYRTLREAQKTTEAAIAAAKASEGTVKIAERTLYDEQRPWVSIQCEKGGPLVIAEDELKITVRFILTNFGNSPATNVNVHPEVVFDHQVAMERLRRITAPAEDGGAVVNRMGHILFPNEKFPLGYTVSARREVIEEFQNRWDPPANFLPVILFGTASYKAASGVETHHTGFMVNIFRTDESGTVPYLAIQDEIGEIPPEDLVLMILPLSPPLT